MLQPPKQTDVIYSAGPTDPIAPLRAALRGHYEIEREIGQGAFATVYLARDLKHERKVAIKVLNADPSSETGELRFIREIRMLARLQHPNILPLHDSGHVETLLYYVMPYVSGDTLRDRIDRQKQLPIEAACSIARDVADALAYAHAQGVIHRDIKPENILLSTGHPILADFGIARVIDLAGVRQLTRTGMGSPGTPAYMSPEQLIGDQELDGRSDTYSLGCVFYEMLAGKTPFAGKEGFVKRFTEPPPSVRVARPDVPTWMEKALSRALERDPQARFQTAQDFVSALAGPHTIAPADSATTLPASSARTATSPGSPIRSVRDPVPHVRRPSPRAFRWLAFGAFAVFAGLIALKAFRSGLFGASEIDPERFVVLPLVAGNENETSTAGQQVADRIYSALNQWDSLPLVADTRVKQALTKRRAVLDEDEAIAIARSLGAGKLIWGQVWGKPGSGRVSVHRYDVAKKESVDSFVFVDTTNDGRIYTPVSLRLLGGDNRPSEAVLADGLTKSYPAWSAYGAGHAALNAWKLDEAEKQFRLSVKADDAFLPARIWLAQVLAWETGYAPGEWEDQSIRATAEPSSLPARDRTIASALAYMRAKNYPGACGEFNRLTESDSLDFVGWYGRGDCQFLDSAVIASPQSPSRWRFRSSYHAAAMNYIRAANVNAGAYELIPFDRLKNLLPTASTQVRSGRGPNPERKLFVAYPGLIGDSLLFVPYDLASFQALPARSTNSSQNSALARDANILANYATSWIRRSPRSAHAYEAYADVLETRGEMLGDVTGTNSALGALRRAREYSGNPGEKARVAAREVWVDFKTFRFAEARALADSVLDNGFGATPEARIAAGLAALTGRVERTASLVAASKEWAPVAGRDFGEPMNTAAAKFFAYSALGICGTEYERAEKDLDDKLDAYVAADEKAIVSDQIKARPYSMIAPCTNAQTTLRINSPVSRIARIQQSFARNDMREFRSRLDSSIADLSSRRPGDLSFDYTYQLAWLRAASGDQQGAERQLDVALNALPSVSTISLRQAAVAAEAVRAMALCSDLAEQLHDGKTAMRWAAAVTLLWGKADPTLQPLVARMRSRSVARSSN